MCGQYDQWRFLVRTPVPVSPIIASGPRSDTSGGAAERGGVVAVATREGKRRVLAKLRGSKRVQRERVNEQEFANTKGEYHGG